MNVDKHGATAPAGGCKDLGDAPSPQGGGGCVDLLDCKRAVAAGDNRTSWRLPGGCAPTWTQCGGSGFRSTACCDPADVCAPANATPASEYMQCAPKRPLLATAAATAAAAATEPIEPTRVLPRPPSLLPLSGLTFPGYMLLPSQNVTVSGSAGCVAQTFSSFNASRLMCESSPGCQLFSDTMCARPIPRLRARPRHVSVRVRARVSRQAARVPRPTASTTARAPVRATPTRLHDCACTCVQRSIHFHDDSSVDSYISISHCVGAAAGVNVSSGSCLPSGATGSDFFQCGGGSGSFATLASFVLPPFLIAKACDENPSCVGFVVTKAQSRGTLVTPVVDAAGRYNVRLPPSLSPASAMAPQGQHGRPASPGAVLGTRASHARSGVPPVPDGFHAFPYDLSSTVGVNVTMAFGPCASNPLGYDPGLMTAAVMMDFCASHAFVCDQFSDLPTTAPRTPPLPPPAPPPPPAAATWKAWKRPGAASITSYVRLTMCAPTPGTCTGSFLKCPGVNVEGAPVVMERYDLPTKILAEACVVKGCHFFTSFNNDTAGVLYAWPGPPVNQTANGFLLVPSTL